MVAFLLDITGDAWQSPQVALADQQPLGLAQVERLRVDVLCLLDDVVEQTHHELTGLGHEYGFSLKTTSATRVSAPRLCAVLHATSMPGTGPTADRGPGPAHGASWSVFQRNALGFGAELRRTPSRKGRWANRRVCVSGHLVPLSELRGKCYWGSRGNSTVLNQGCGLSGYLSNTLSYLKPSGPSR